MKKFKKSIRAKNIMQAFILTTIFVLTGFSLSPNTNFNQNVVNATSIELPFGVTIDSIFTDQKLDELPELTEVPDQPSNIKVYGHLSNDSIIELTDSCYYIRDTEPEKTTGFKTGAFRFTPFKNAKTTSGEPIFASYRYILNEPFKAMVRRLNELKVDVPFVFGSNSYQDPFFLCDMIYYHPPLSTLIDYVAFKKVTSAGVDPENNQIAYIESTKNNGLKGYFTLKNSSLGEGYFNIKYTECKLSDLGYTETEYYIGFDSGLKFYSNLNQNDVYFDWTIIEESGYVFKLVSDLTDVYFPGVGIHTGYEDISYAWGSKLSFPVFEVLINNLQLKNRNYELTNVLTTGMHTAYNNSFHNVTKKVEIVSDNEDVLRVSYDSKDDVNNLEVIQEEKEASCTIYVDGVKSKYKKYFYTTKRLVEDNSNLYFANSDYTLFGNFNELQIETTSEVNLLNSYSGFTCDINKGATFSVRWYSNKAWFYFSGSKTTIEPGLRNLFQKLEVDGKELFYCLDNESFLAFVDDEFCYSKTPQFINTISFDSEIKYEFWLSGKLEKRNYFPGDTFDPTGLKIYIFYYEFNGAGLKVDITDQIKFNKIPYSNFVDGEYRGKYVRFDLEELDVALPDLDTIKVNGIPNYVYPDEDVFNGVVSIEVDFKDSKNKYHKKYIGDQLHKTANLSEDLSQYIVTVNFVDWETIGQTLYVDIIDDIDKYFKFGDSYFSVEVGEKKKINFNHTLRSIGSVSYSFTDDNPDEDIIKIDNYGNIVGLLPGVATITAKVHHGYLIGEQIISMDIHVLQYAETATFIEKEVSVYKCEKSSISIYFTFSPENTNSKDFRIYDENDNDYYWFYSASEKLNYVYVELNNLDIGEHTLTLCSTVKKIVYDTCKLNVLGPDIILETDHVLLSIGDTYQINAEVHTNFNQLVSYESNNNGVADVDINGLITAYKEGFAVITITSGINETQVAKRIYVTVGDTEINPVIDIYVPSSIEIFLGETYQLQPLTIPDNATGQSFTYRSLSATIASVDEEGLISAEQIGETKIIITSEFGECEKEIIVKVVANPNPIPVRSISLSISEDKIFEVGETATINAVVSPSYATNQELSWSSSDENLVSLSSNANKCTFECLASGVVSITAKSVSNPEISASIQITIKNYDIRDFELDVENNIINLIKGDDYQVRIKSTDPTNYDGSFLYSIKDPMIASVDENGLIHAKKYGTTTLEVCDENRLVTKTTTINVLIGEFNLTHDSYSGVVGTTFYIQNDKNLSSSHFDYYCSDEKIATVNSSGLLTLKAIGETTLVVSAKDGSYSATASVTVLNNELQGFEIKEDNLTLNFGEIHLIEIESLTPSYAAMPQFRCESSNEEVATVEGMTIRAVGPGDTDIVIYPSNNTELRKIIHVHVNFEFTLNYSKFNTSVGSSFNLIPNISGYGEGNARLFTFTSSNLDVASVDENGLVTCLKPGVAEISVSYKNGDTLVCTVNVTQEPLNTDLSINLDKEEYKPGDQININIENLSDYANSSVEFVSLNTDVIMVDSFGNINVISSGEAAILVIVTDENGVAVSSTINVDINSEETPFNPTISGNKILVGAAVTGGLVLTLSLTVGISIKRKRKKLNKKTM